ncbi:MAG: efflux RND transporter periplasmic adaptor subunit [Rickettsia sp.]|nr:efflux RND transporter periplasmic adaptor subunit [Rickettsia sp.]
MKKIFLICFFLNFSLAIADENVKKTALPKVIVTAHTISYKNFSKTIHVIGLCRYLNSIDYYAQSDGEVDYLKDLSELKVKTNDFILGIDSSLYKQKLDLAYSSIFAAEKSYRRDQILFQKNIISEESLDHSKVSYEKAKYEMEVASKSYKNNFIIAPFDGKIGAIKLHLKDHVKKGEFLFSLTKNFDESEKIIFIDVSEKLYQKITNQTSITFYDLNNVKHSAEIISVSDYLSEKGVIQLKVKTTKKAKLIHNSYLDLEIIYDQHDALAVPEKSVLRDSEGHYVYKILEDQSLEKIYLKTKTPNDNQGIIEFLANDKLKEDDVIILDGVNKVQKHSLVEVQKK